MLTAAGNVQKDLKLSGLNKQSQKKLSGKKRSSRNVWQIWTPWYAS